MRQGDLSVGRRKGEPVARSHGFRGADGSLREQATVGRMLRKLGYTLRRRSGERHRSLLGEELGASRAARGVAQDSRGAQGLRHRRVGVAHRHDADPRLGVTPCSVP
jgi:hypothetical protein